MALVVEDRVRETSTTAGTGTFTLAGAVTGYQSFGVVGNGNTTYYTIYLQGGNEWEVGIGTYTSSGTTLSRDTVLASSSGGAKINFSAGVKDVFVTYPADRSVYYDSATNVTLNALTLSGGTANGVPYLNASKVLTTGSALTFDGTNLGIGIGSPLVRLDSRGDAYFGANARVQIVETGGDAVIGGRAGTNYLAMTVNGSEQMRLTSTGLKSSIAGTNADPVFSYTSDTNTGIFFPAADKLGFTAGGGSDQMVLTTTGLGLGTNNPTDTQGFGRALDIQSASFGGALYIRSSTNNSTTYGYFGYDGSALAATLAAFGSSTKLQFATGTGAGSIKATLDSSGNLGLGVTPSAWQANGKALEFSAGAIYSYLSGASGEFDYAYNAYFDGGWKYKASSSAASLYSIQPGVYKWFNAPSGTANSASVTSGASYTVVALGSSTLAQWQAFFNDSSNNPLTVTPTLGQVLTGNATGTLLGGGLVTQNISFTQAMTLDASGNLLVGGTSVYGATITSYGSASRSGGLGIRNSAGTAAGGIYTGAAGSGGGSTDIYVESVGLLGFSAGGTEKARISSDGTFRVKGAGTAGSTDAVQFSGSAPASTLILDSDGDLGIGTTNPASKLDVRGVITGGDGTIKTVVSYTGTGGVTGTTSNHPYIFYANNDERARITSTGQFQWSPNGSTQAMTLDASGNLGIGPTSMGARLDVQGANVVLASDGLARIGSDSSGADTGGQITFRNSDARRAAIAGRQEGGDALAGYLQFGTRGTSGDIAERARITSGGYFKASDNGTYNSSTGGYHELYQSTVETAAIISAVNASFANNILQLNAARNTTNNSFYALSYYNSGAGAYKLRVADSGSISTAGSIQLGDAGAPPTSGVGVKFPATQSASSDANTLDDYEEGTWTPTMGGATFTYTSQGGRYTKVGNVVTVWAQIEVASYTSATGLFIINNLPFTVVNDATVRGGASTVCCVSGITFDNYVTGEPGSNSVVMYLESNRSNNTRVDMNSSNFAAGGFRLFVTSTYQTSA